MASVNVDAYQYKHYNSGWSSWSTNLYGGYSGSTKYAAVIRYKLPDMSQKLPPYTISVKIPWIRQTTSAESGTFTIYLFTSDPTGRTPSNVASTTDPVIRDKVTKSWSETDHELHTTTVTLEYSPSAPTTATYFYIWIANSVDFLEIGYKGEVTASSYRMTITYGTAAVWLDTTGASDGSGWKRCIVWLDTTGASDGSGWKQVQPWIDTTGASDGSGWQKCGAG